MAPATVTLIRAALPFIGQLATRDGTSNPGGKTNAQYATEGRFDYPPSFAAAVLFLVLYVIVVLANLILIFRHRAWFWWVMNLAVISKSLGSLGASLYGATTSPRAPYHESLPA